MTPLITNGGAKLRVDPLHLQFSNGLSYLQFLFYSFWFSLIVFRLESHLPHKLTRLSPLRLQLVHCFFSWFLLYPSIAFRTALVLQIFWEHDDTWTFVSLRLLWFKVHQRAVNLHLWGWVRKSCLCLFRWVFIFNRISFRMLFSKDTLSFRNQIYFV